MERAKRGAFVGQDMLPEIAQRCHLERERERKREREKERERERERERGIDCVCE